MVDEILSVGAETGAALVVPHGAEVHVDLVLDAVSRDGWRLLLRRAETVSRLGERADC